MGCCGKGKSKVPEQLKPASKKKMPRATTRLRNAAKAAKRFVASGGKVTPKDERNRRMEICIPCEYNLGGWCSDCGCWINLKVRSEAEPCELGFWEKESDDEKERI